MVLIRSQPLSAAALVAAALLAPGSVRAQAEVFAPGVVSDSNVWKGTFTPDGRSLYFFRKVGEGEDYRIFRSERVGTKWSRPERIDLGGGDWSELYPTVSPDGERMAFTTYRPVSGDTSAHPQAALWMVSRRGDGWADAVYLQALNVLGKYHSQPTFDAAGTLIFRRDGGDGRGAVTYAARWNGGGFETPEPFEPVNRWKGALGPSRYVWGGSPSPDHSSVVLEVSSIDANGRRSPSDLWIACRRGASWIAPRPIEGGANSPGRENFVFHSADGSRLFFVRDLRLLMSIPSAGLCP